MKEEWGQRNNAPILRPGWGLGLNRPSFWQKDGVRKILQPLTGIFCPPFFCQTAVGILGVFAGSLRGQRLGSLNGRLHRRDGTPRRGRSKHESILHHAWPGDYGITAAIIEKKTASVFRE